MKKLVFLLSVLLACSIMLNLYLLMRPPSKTTTTRRAEYEKQQITNKSSAQDDISKCVDDANKRSAEEQSKLANADLSTVIKQEKENLIRQRLYTNIISCNQK